MVRDFTEGTEEMLAEAVEYAIANTGQEEEMQLSVDVLGEVCEMDYSEIVSNAIKLQSASRGYGNAQLNAATFLQLIFQNARRKDAETVTTISEGVAEASDEYIKSLTSLVNCINVGGLGDTYEQFYYYKGYYHSTYEASIFGDSSLFAEKVAAAGNGVYGAFYNSINPDIPGNKERLYEFLQRDPATVEDWELDAILTILDSCVIVDESSGDTTLDYEKINMILTGFYTEENYNPLNGFRSYTNYYASDMLGYLASEYDMYYRYRTLGYSRLEPPLSSYADLNAILTSTSVYYDSVKTSFTEIGLDEYGMRKGMDFGIVVSEESDGLNRIVISTAQDDWEERNICLNPFAWNPDLYDEGAHDIYITKAQSDAVIHYSIVNQKGNELVSIQDAVVKKFFGDIGSKASDKADGYIDKAVTGALGVAGPGPVAAYRYVKSYVDVVQETQEANEKIENEIKIQEYEEYCKNLCLGGQSASCGDEQILVLNVKPDENELRIKVAYYNLEKNEDLTVEEVLESYDAFARGDDEGAATVESFDMAFCNGEGAEIGSEAAFRDAVNYVLGKDGTSVTFASEEQVEAAIQYVKNNPEVIKLLQGEE